MNEQHVEDAARKRPLVYDKGGDAHYDFISAFIKSMRGSDPDAAVYYLAAMLEGGEDARFIARRMVVLASEDIGNADPRALLVAVAAAQAVEHVGLPEARLNLAQAAIYLARAPKSNASYVALKEATADVRELGQTGRRTRCATRTTAARRSSAAARATSTRTTTRAASRPTICRSRARQEVLPAVRVRRGGRRLNESCATIRPRGGEDEKRRSHSARSCRRDGSRWPGRSARRRPLSSRPRVTRRPARLDRLRGQVGAVQAPLLPPGLTVALAHDAPAAEARSGGAQLAFWAMSLKRAVGTPARPANPRTIPAATARSLQTPCASPAARPR